MRYCYHITNTASGATSSLELDPRAPDAQARLAAAMKRAKGSSLPSALTVKAEPVGGPSHIREALRVAAAEIDAARAKAVRA